MTRRLTPNEFGPRRTAHPRGSVDAHPAIRTVAPERACAPVRLRSMPSAALRIWSDAHPLSCASHAGGEA